MQPNRGVPQRRATTSTIVIVGLLVTALAVGGVLWATLRNPSSGRSANDTSISATGNSGPGLTTANGEAVPFTRTKVSALTSFDPLGDGTENETRVRYARDGKTSTAWLTNCYQNPYFGAKQGVGLVVRLSGPAQGVLALRFPSAPWTVDVYAASEPSASLDGWGTPISKNASQRANTATVVMNQPGRYLLLMLRQVARDKGCNSANPFRGGFSEISFGPTLP